MPGPEEHCSGRWSWTPTTSWPSSSTPGLLDGSGDKASAHKYYQQVLRRLPQDAEVHYYYGRSLGEAGKVFDAYLHLAYSSLYQNDKRKTESWLKQARPLARTPVEQDQLKRFEAIYAERQEVWK